MMCGLILENDKHCGLLVNGVEPGDGSSGRVSAHDIDKCVSFAGRIVV